MRGATRINRFACSKCGLVFEEEEQKQHCEAPLYLTKVQRAAQEMAYVADARLRGEPLSSKEEHIAKAIDTVVADPPNMLTPEKLAEFRKEWTNLVFSTQGGHRIAESFNAFVARKLKEEK
jgi:uncharacterized protein YnzC (UPF0291/DUF896 family)